MPAPPHLRNAILVHGLGLAALGAGWLAHYALESDAGFAFQLTGMAAALVLIVWSVFLSVRAVRAGGSRKWAAAICVLAALEVNAPAVYGWACLTEKSWDSLLIPAGYPIIAPVLTAVFAIVLAMKAIRRSNRVWLLWSALTAGALLLAILLFGALPCGLWLLGAAAKANDCDVGLNTAMNACLPDVLKVGTEKLCASVHAARRIRRAACANGQIPPARLQKNLSDWDDAIAYSSWRGLSEHPDAQLRAAMAVARDELHTNTMIHTYIGALLATRGSVAQIEEVLQHAERLPMGVERTLAAGLYDRVDLFPLLEKMLTHGQLVTNDVVRMVATLCEMTTPKTSLGDVAWTKREIYRAWYARNLNDLTAQMKLVSLAKCKDLSMQRLAIFALANMRHEKLYATPFWDAADAKGAPVPVSLEESEEAAKLIQSVREGN